MAISADKKAMLKTWAAAGDIMALEALSLEAMGRAGFMTIGNPGAPDIAVHAAIRGDTAVTPVTTAITNPVVPRNLAVVMGADHYDGGDVTVTGTDQYDKVISEVFTAGLGVTRIGSKVFKTVTSIAHALLGTSVEVENAFTVQTGSKIGVLVDFMDAYAMGMCDGVPEKAVLDLTNNSVLFTTAPNGTRVFTLLCNL